MRDAGPGPCPHRHVSFSSEGMPPERVVVDANQRYVVLTRRCLDCGRVVERRSRVRDPGPWRTARPPERDDREGRGRGGAA